MRLVRIERTITDGKIRHVLYWNDIVTREHFDSAELVLDEGAVVDHGAGSSAVVSDEDAVALVEQELRVADFGALLARVARPIVDARRVERHVDAVAEVVAEGRLVEDAPATVVCYVDAIVLVVLQSAGIDRNITWLATK